jgi:hypothetical protein
VPGSAPGTATPAWALRAFVDFQIPEDLRAGYGYPQLTDQAKRKILGENLLRLHGMDVAQTTARLGRPRSRSGTGRWAERGVPLARPACCVGRVVARQPVFRETLPG